MNSSRLTIINKWSIASILMILIDLVCHILWRFDIKSTLYILIIEGMLLLCFGESLVEKQNRKRITYPHFIFSVLTISIAILSIYLFGQALSITGEKYIYWVTHLKMINSKSIEYEVATLILFHYFIIIGVYHNEIWKLIKSDIYRCLPNLWCILFGIGWMIYSRGDFNYIQRVGSLFILAVVMVAYLVYKTFVGREQDIVYDVNPRQYLTVFIGCFLGICLIWSYIPNFQELPGSRWFRTTLNSIGKKPSVYEKIPYITRLDNDIPLSDAILFEVKAMEPLYLREIAYNEYLDGVWRVSELQKQEENYSHLQVDSLNAEYIQLDTLLDEIFFLSKQDSSIFPEYARMASYETSTIRKKAYQVLQNPINKINYFTVNDFINVKDQLVDEVYYYQDINNCYFYSKHMIEPSNYTVTYYDRIPRMGSREYIFLKNMNGMSWERIYNQVLESRKKYRLHNKNIQESLDIYTSLDQYEDVKTNFLQIPEEIKNKLTHFTRELVGEEKSDWDNAIFICDFLRNNYLYDLGSKNSEGDRVLNFLFIEKKGICQDFATSMTLMCRSIGMPAKYVTGYYASEKNKETGNYIIREKDAHAFVEVYIAGYGWMSFDPTPNSNEQDNRKGNSSDSRLSTYIDMIMIGTIILIIILFPKDGNNYLQEKYWSILFKVTPPQRKLERLMIHQEKYLDKSGLSRTEYETLSQYMQRLEQWDIDIATSVKLYEAQKYGGIEVTKDQIQEAYKSYKRLKVILKKLK